MLGTQAAGQLLTRASPGGPQVNGKGTAVMSSFSAALGLDAPVEIVNSRVRGRWAARSRRRWRGAGRGAGWPRRAG